MSKPRDELAQALTLEDETERKLAVVSLIDTQVQRIEWRAIVIGGLAVEFWTHGAYSTTDIDLYLPHGPAVERPARRARLPQGGTALCAA